MRGGERGEGRRGGGRRGVAPRRRRQRRRGREARSARAAPVSRREQEGAGGSSLPRRHTSATAGLIISTNLGPSRPISAHLAHISAPLPLSLPLGPSLHLRPSRRLRRSSRRVRRDEGEGERADGGRGGGEEGGEARPREHVDEDDALVRGRRRAQRRLRAACLGRKERERRHRRRVRAVVEAGAVVQRCGSAAAAADPPEADGPVDRAERAERAAPRHAQRRDGRRRVERLEALHGRGAGDARGGGVGDGFARRARQPVHQQRAGQHALLAGRAPAGVSAAGRGEVRRRGDGTVWRRTMRTPPAAPGRKAQCDHAASTGTSEGRRGGPAAAAAPFVASVWSCSRRGRLPGCE